MDQNEVAKILGERRDTTKIIREFLTENLDLEIRCRDRSESNNTVRVRVEVGLRWKDTGAAIASDSSEFTIQLPSSY